jgi:hypothetical protein
LEEVRKREEEERVREAAVEARAEGFRERWRVLAEATCHALGEYWDKTLSKEGLHAKNAELKAKAKAINREEHGEANEGETENEEEEKEEKRDEEREDEGRDEEEYDGLPVIRMRKRKAVVLEDDKGEDEVDELKGDTTTGRAKRLRREEAGLLVFKGLVSLI